MKKSTILSSLVLLTLCFPIADARAGSQLTATKAALATPSPTATQVGLTVLKNGGNAIDAAVAVEFALSVAQPHNGALGGGGYLTYFDASTGAIWTLDFRESAPTAETPQMLSEAKKSRAGVTTAAVPGTVAGLDAMHKRFGSRPWKELLQPAILLATEGVRIDDDLAARLIASKSERAIDQFPSTASLFYPGGKPLEAGGKIIQTDLGATLTRLAEVGGRDFYTGEIGNRLIDTVHSAGGVLTARDLREYAPIWRAPLRFRVGEDDIYTIGPPSGGGMQLGVALNILGGLDLIAAGFQTPLAIHLIAEAERRAAIDCARYIGDPSATRVPYRDLLSTERAAGWRKSIRPDKVTTTIALSEPGAPLSLPEHAVHFVIADEAGDIASLTTTSGDSFGGGFLVPTLGFFLNDSVRDFTDPSLTSPTNAVASGRRPSDSMTSILALRNGRPYLALGTTGDSGTNSTNLQVLLDVLLYDQPLPEAVAAPRFEQRNMPDDLVYERGITTEGTVNALNAMGHAVLVRESIGDVQALMFEAGRIVAVADRRHGGAAGGY